MANDEMPNGTPEQRVTFVAPVEEALTLDAATLLERNNARLSASASARYPGQSGVLYDKDLEGVPFVCVSEFVPVTFDGQWGAREQLCGLIRIVNDDGTFSESVRVYFGGAYIRRALMRMKRDELVGAAIFTLARNTSLRKTPNGAFPLMLALYDPAVDDTSQDDMPLDADEEDGWAFDTSGYRRDAALERAGVTVKRGRGRPRKNPEQA